jgi:hypothetical protein
LSTGTYHIPNSPITSPATQVHSHQRDPAGIESRTMSNTTSATAHAMVTTAVTTRSSASFGGGGGSGLLMMQG